MVDTEKLRYVMATRFMGVGELASKAGISRTSLYYLLRGTHKPKPATLKAICQALECDPADILVAPKEG